VLYLDGKISVSPFPVFYSEYFVTDNEVLPAYLDKCTPALRSQMRSKTIIE